MYLSTSLRSQFVYLSENIAATENELKNRETTKENSKLHNEVKFVTYPALFSTIQKIDVDREKRDSREHGLIFF